MKKGLKIQWHKKKSISNYITLFRIFLLPFLCYFLYKSQIPTLSKFNQLIASILLCTSLLSDFLDGWVARKFHQKTLLGKYMDPLADKLISFFVLTILVIVYGIPLWVFLLLVLRDLIVSILSYLLFKKYNRTIVSNFLGKLSIPLLGLVTFAYIYEFNFRNILLTLSLLSSYLSLFGYIYSAYRMRSSLYKKL